MEYDKREYEILIENSVLFTLDKETQHNSYKKEAFKMVEYLYCYLCAINKNKYEELGCEIVEFANRCIASFDKTKGEFLHYFNAGWKNEYRKIRQDSTEDARYRGLHVSEADKRSVRKYLRLAESRGLDCGSDDFLRNLAEAMNLSEDEVREIVDLSGVTVVSNVSHNSDEEEFDLLDLLPTNDRDYEMLPDMENVVAALSKIDIEYNSLQDRQKKIVSDVMTAKICELIDEINISSDSFDFINDEILEEYKKTKTVPTQREIAEKYNRDEASISRTVNDFIKKIINVLSEV